MPAEPPLAGLPDEPSTPPDASTVPPAGAVPGHLRPPAESRARTGTARGASEGSRPTRRDRPLWQSLLVNLLIAGAVVSLVQAFVVRVHNVASGSMQQTLGVTDRVLSSRLPYMFACCRFAHYLKVMVRDKVGSYYEKEQLERWLNNWIVDYVVGDPQNASEALKCMRPLAGAQITIHENEENPGYYTGTFDLRPHFQLEGMDIGLRLVSRLPVAK